LENKVNLLAKNKKNKNAFNKKEQSFPSNYKKLPCQFYINGACHKGNDCTYSHDIPQNYKTELCKYYLAGTCTKNNDCLYSHETKNFPCKYFHAVGFCEKGDDCRFAHNRLTYEEVKKFIETNEEFLNELLVQTGRTNMNDYFFQYIKEKKE